MKPGLRVQKFRVYLQAVTVEHEFLMRITIQYSTN